MEKNTGNVTRENDGYKVVFRRDLPYAITKVWEAITDPEKLKIWFTDIDMNLTEGSRITFYFRDAAHTASFGEVLRVDPPRFLQYSWEGELATWELTEKGENSCHLKFTYSKLSDQYATSVPAGFHLLLDQLQTILEGRVEPYPFGGEENADGKALERMYAAIMEEKIPGFKRDDGPVIVTKLVNAGVSRVWEALTDYENMKQWYFDIPGFKPVPGHRFNFMGGEEGKEQYKHLCEVMEVVKYRRLSYSWKYEGYEGLSFVMFDLFEEGEQTRVVVTHTGLETFPASVTSFARKNFVGGWKEIVQKLLPEFLSKKK